MQVKRTKIEGKRKGITKAPASDVLPRTRDLVVLGVVLVGWLGLSGAGAEGSPFVHMELQGRIHDSGDPYDNLVLGGYPGTVIDYILVMQLQSPLGATNSNGGGHTVTSFTAGVDGLNSLKVDLFQDPTDTSQDSFLVPATLEVDPTPWPNDSWSAGPGASGGQITPRPGALTYNDLLGIEGVHASGVFTGAGEIVASGTFVEPDAFPAFHFMRIRWSRDGVGLLKINGGDLITIDSATELGSDPYVSFEPLRLDPQVPEPRAVVLLAVGAIGFLRRRAGVKISA